MDYYSKLACDDRYSAEDRAIFAQLAIADAINRLAAALKERG